MARNMYLNDDNADVEVLLLSFVWVLMIVLLLLMFGAFVLLCPFRSPAISYQRTNIRQGKHDMSMV
jgi:hypothetical protein